MRDPLLLTGLAGEPSAILVDGGRIAALGRAAEAQAEPGSTTVVRATGLRAVAGFIELQVNGVGHHDFTTDPTTMWRAGRELARNGVTAFLPTIVTSPRGTVERAIEALADAPKPIEGAVPVGIHVEGPFIAPARRGAHDERHLREPDLDEIARWVAGGVRVLTLAPELPGAVEAIRRVVAAGAVASVGHTDADATTTEDAIDAGARYATHLFNAMPPLHHRAPGAVGALLGDDRVTLGVIADGVHVHPAVLALAARLATGRISLVSDQVADRLGDAALATDAGTARLVDGTLAGSLHSLDHGVRTFAGITGSLEAALGAVTTIPARLLGLDDGRGSLLPGGRADITLLDDRLHVLATLVAGEVAFRSEVIAWP